MRSRITHVLLVVLALLAAAASAQQQPVRVLFIGNSYTYYNNLPEMFAALVASSTPARDVEVANVGMGGGTLTSHWEQGRALQAIRGNRWDYVVLQEQSLLDNQKARPETPRVGDSARFSAAVRKFDAEIKKAGAKTVLYMTWARRDFPGMQPQLTDAYARVAHELGAILVPAGVAWQTARTQAPEVSLYAADGSHPTPAATYLVACVFFTKLFGMPPNSTRTEIVGHRFDESRSEFDLSTQVQLVRLTPESARKLRDIAAEAALKGQ